MVTNCWNYSTLIFVVLLEGFLSALFPHRRNKGFRQVSTEPQKYLLMAEVSRLELFAGVGTRWQMMYVEYLFHGGAFYPPVGTIVCVYTPRDRSQRFGGVSANTLSNRCWKSFGSPY